MGAELVEVHVPLPAEAGRWWRPARWIRDVENFLESDDEAAVYDDGEEYEGHYVFFIWDAPLERLLALAAEAVALPGVPSGAFAMVTDTDAAEFGLGRRVELSGHQRT